MATKTSLEIPPNLGRLPHTNTALDYSKIEKAIDSLPDDEQLDLANRIFTKHDDGRPTPDELIAICEAEGNRESADYTPLSDVKKRLGL